MLGNQRFPKPFLNGDRAAELRGIEDLNKKDKSIVKLYLAFVTGYSDSQLDRFIREKKERGTLKVKERTQYTFPRFYEARDIALLAEVANGYEHQNGHA